MGGVGPLGQGVAAAVALAGLGGAVVNPTVNTSPRPAKIAASPRDIPAKSSPGGSAAERAAALPGSPTPDVNGVPAPRRAGRRRAPVRPPAADAPSANPVPRVATPRARRDPGQREWHRRLRAGRRRRGRPRPGAGPTSRSGSGAAGSPRSSRCPRCPAAPRAAGRARAVGRVRQPAYLTTTVPSMPGCTVHTYLIVPGVVNFSVNVSPAAMAPGEPDLKSGPGPAVFVTS